MSAYSVREQPIPTMGNYYAPSRALRALVQSYVHLWQNILCKSTLSNLPVLIPQETLKSIILLYTEIYGFKRDGGTLQFLPQFTPNKSKNTSGKTIIHLCIVKVYKLCTYSAANIVTCSASSKPFLRYSKWFLWYI